MTVVLCAIFWLLFDIFIIFTYLCQYITNIVVMEVKEIGQKIRARRKVLNLSIGELAELTGFSRTTISDIELGKTNPRLDILNEIFYFLNLEMRIEIKQTQ